MNYRYLAVDFNPESVRKMKKQGIPHCYGDAEDDDFLDEIGAGDARMIISTVPRFSTNLSLVSYYRTHNKDGIIIAISHNIKETMELYRAGASFVVMPHYLGAKYASEMVESIGIMGEESGWGDKRAKHIEYLNERQKFVDEEI
jgi:voltage-gated potassium channel Kch